MLSAELVNHNGIYVKDETLLIPGKMYTNYNGSFRE